MDPIIRSDEYSSQGIRHDRSRLASRHYLRGHRQAPSAPTGRAYRARFALHLTVENGLVTRHHVDEDSLAVAQAFQE